MVKKPVKEESAGAREHGSGALRKIADQTEELMLIGGGGGRKRKKEEKRKKKGKGKECLGRLVTLSKSSG